MGAINYFTSDYITLAINTNDYNNIYNDADAMQELTEIYNTDPDAALDIYINDCLEADYENAKYILDKYDFYYFHVVIKPGYYEGFSIDIEANYGIYYDDYIEKRDAQKEITQLKKCLLELAGVGLVSCTPGWCTGYKNYKNTITDIKNAIKAIRADAANTPTWTTYARAELA